MPNPSNPEGLSNRQLRQLQNAFKVVDADGDNSIDVSELGAVLRSLGQQLTETELAMIMDEVDSDGNGSIEFAEFCHLMKKSFFDHGTAEGTETASDGPSPTPGSTDDVHADRTAQDASRLSGASTVSQGSRTT